jgi:hypothetical protein
MEVFSGRRIFKRRFSRSSRGCRAHSKRLRLATVETFKDLGGDVTLYDCNEVLQNILSSMESLYAVAGDSVTIRELNWWGCTSVRTDLFSAATEGNKQVSLVLEMITLNRIRFDDCRWTCPESVFIHVQCIMSN